MQTTHESTSRIPERCAQGIAGIDDLPTFASDRTRTMVADLGARIRRIADLRTEAASASACLPGLLSEARDEGAVDELFSRLDRARRGVVLANLLEARLPPLKRAAAESLCHDFEVEAVRLEREADTRAESIRSKMGQAGLGHLAEGAVGDDGELVRLQAGAKALRHDGPVFRDRHCQPGDVKRAAWCAHCAAAALRVES